MEANICDINHLDADVLLPPRKRLLAGLKKQNSDTNRASFVSLDAPSTPSSSVFDTRLNSLLRAHSNPCLSPEEIVEASRSAAVAAAKIAKAARAAAEEKAAIASKAIAAAKTALDLVASFSEDGNSDDKSLKRNKLKRHVPVHSLYKRNRQVGNRKMDEELARRLHQVMNSSPRISKNSSNSDSSGPKHVRLGTPPIPIKTRVAIERSLVNPNRHTVAGDVDSEGSEGKKYRSKPDVAVLRKRKHRAWAMEKRESSLMKETLHEEMCLTSNGRKRGRMKLKKLPLSICTIRDQVNPKDDLGARNLPLVEQNTGNVTLFSVEPSIDGRTPAEMIPFWRCQELKAPACIKQNKVGQS